MRVIVTGSTTWTDADAIRRELAILPAESIVIIGDCDGVDALAAEIAHEIGLIVEAYRKEAEDFRSHGQAAWKRLNERMIETGVDLVLAFHPDIHAPDKARGSKHMLQLAEKHQIETRAFTQ